MAYEFKKQLTRFLVLYLFILLIFVGANIWIGYDVNRRVNNIQNHKKEIFSYAHATETLAALKTDFEKAKSEKLFLESILPQSGELINFSKDIGSLAKQANVEVSFSFGSEMGGTEEVPGFIVFNFVVIGPASNWLRFLTSLERSRYLVAFDSFTVNTEDKNYRLNVNGKVFTQ